MKSEEEANARELTPADLRGILKYVPQWRNHTFVVALDGAVFAEEHFSNLMLELAVLHNLGIRLVLCFGVGQQLADLGKARKVAITDARGYGPTDGPTLELATEAAGVLQFRLMQGLTSHGLRCAQCNAVRATERGILKGVDQLYAGKVDRVDTGVLESLLDREIIPVISPLAFGREGAAYRINSDLLASELAIALKASKLIFLLPYPGLTIRGKFRLNIAVQEVREVLEKDPEAIDEEVRSKAQHAVRTIEGGTPRAHIIDSRIHDGLLMEIFSKVGIGSMIHSNPYAQIRRARRRDVSPIFNLTKMGVRSEELRARSRTAIDQQFGDYFVYEIDESVIGCFRLSPLSASEAELGSVFVHSAYQGRDIGRTLVEYAIEEARRSGWSRLFALTTQAVPFFKNVCGFTEAPAADVPPALRDLLRQSKRNSRVLVRLLDKEPS
ncbi:MAG: amino-acid N-acetyltransferase [Opitutales bacterium]|nr:amino-acid N-acetyltransferase [Opitutales bacterium]